MRARPEQHTHVADIREWNWNLSIDRLPDLVWASPPCQEFSRHTMPWTRAKNPAPPDLSIGDLTERVERGETVCVSVKTLETVLTVLSITGGKKLDWHISVENGVATIKRN